jgi:hypothetical protein
MGCAYLGAAELPAKSHRPGLPDGLFDHSRLQARWVKISNTLKQPWNKKARPGIGYGMKSGNTINEPGALEQIAGC